METQLERISAVECRVRVAIPWATVSPRWEQRLKDLGRRAQVPGFRRGKVPVRVIERMFGPSVRDELARDLVTETFPDAVAEHEQTPLTEPVRESFSLKRGEPFTYVVRFEVPPMIEPKDYEGVPVRRRPAALDEARVDREIAALRDQHTEIRPIPEDSDRTETRAGDLWTLDLEGKVGDAPVSLKDVKVEIGATVKEAIPGLAKALEGTPLAAVGATRELSFTTDEANGGRPAQLKVGLRDVREKIQPALDDEFAADTGLAETFAELRAQIEGRVRDEDQQQAEREARTRLVNELLERNDFEVAPSMIAREAAAQVNLYKQQVAQQGLTLAQIGQTEAQLYNQIRPRAAVNVRAYLLLDAIGKKHEIDVSDEELSEEIQQMADERNQNVDRLRASLERDNQLLLLRARLRETKILDFLMEKAEITEAPDPEHDHDHDHDHDHHDHDHDHHHHHHDHDHDHDHDHAAD